MSIEEIVKSSLTGDKRKVEIGYLCRTTRTNSEYIEVSINGEKCLECQGYNVDKFTNELVKAVHSLKAEMPNIHIVYAKHEFHFYYSGFNSCHPSVVPESVSIVPLSEEPVKRGIVKEKFKMTGKSKVLEMLEKYKGYELYYRCGFGFRGAQERRMDEAALLKAIDGMFCCDIKVVDNEIHVNEFTASDMY